jgi:tRNA (guanine26-N2/guanine27-N2)-dimethyltransferase
MHEFTEGGARFFAEASDVISADMGVFYNPLMRENRDASLLVLSWLFTRRTPKRLCFPLAASGVRPIRMLEELEVPSCEVFINDANPRAIDAARSSLTTNERASCWPGVVSFSNMNAGSILASHAFDYIEIDPFGSPLEFLDSAIRSITHRGILAVTATDTAALCGTYPKTGLRKYHAFTKRSPLMHEHAVRILAHVVERDAARYGRAARVVFAVAHLHYIKLFFEITHSRSDALALVKNAEYWLIDGAGYPFERCSFVQGRREDMIGPLSAQPLYDRDLLAHADATSAHLSEAFRTRIALIRDEARVDGYALDLHALSSELELASVPKTATVLQRLGPERAVRTQFCLTAIRTSAPRDEIREAMR